MGIRVIGAEARDTMMFWIFAAAASLLVWPSGWGVFEVFCWFILILPIAIEFEPWPRYWSLSHIFARWFWFSRRANFFRLLGAALIIGYVLTHRGQLRPYEIVFHLLTVWMLMVNANAPAFLRAPTTPIGRYFEMKRLHRELHHH